MCIIVGSYTGKQGRSVVNIVLTVEGGLFPEVSTSSSRPPPYKGGRRNPAPKWGNTFSNEHMITNSDSRADQITMDICLATATPDR